jgi:hypothetical protein
MPDCGENSIYPQSSTHHRSVIPTGVRLPGSPRTGLRPWGGVADAVEGSAVASNRLDAAIFIVPGAGSTSCTTAMKKIGCRESQRLFVAAVEFPEGTQEDSPG